MSITSHLVLRNVVACHGCMFVSNVDPYISTLQTGRDQSRSHAPVPPSLLSSPSDISTYTVSHHAATPLHNDSHT